MRELPEALEYMVAEVAGSTHVEKIQTVWYQLQGYVDGLYDAELNRLVKSTTKGMRQVGGQDFFVPLSTALVILLCMVFELCGQDHHLWTEL